VNGDTLPDIARKTGQPIKYVRIIIQSYLDSRKKPVIKYEEPKPLTEDQLLNYEFDLQMSRTYRFLRKHYGFMEENYDFKNMAKNLRNTRKITNLGVETVGSFNK
jgi:hypothetical protein